ncbi:MAG: GAF domain-containing SpoIIE family protein phosphatase [Candidatus Pelagibacter sp.]
MFLFKTKKSKEETKPEISQDNLDLQMITNLNQDFALSLDLNETLNTALKVIINRINAQAANIFLINDKINKFECIASLNQDHLDEYKLDLKDGVMAKALEQKKCIRVGDVRKDVREIAEFYFDLDNKTNFTTLSVLCAPLIAANECLGVIHCSNKKTALKLFVENDRKLLETLSAPAALAIRNAKMASEMVEKNKIQKEVEIVGDIQKSLLSENSEDTNFPIAGLNIPAKVVSGDFYNFTDLGNGKYGFGVADVSGKGIKSSLLMSKASSLYSCLSKTNFSTSDLLFQLNNEICETISRGMFVTMIIGIYDSNNKEMSLSNAGHEHPLIFSNDHFTNFEDAGPPLGIIPNIKYQEHRIKFENSSMYIFTDGITEIKNPKGDMLGSEGFKNYIRKFKDFPTNQKLQLIIDQVLNTGHIQKDDLTLVVIDAK